jgi:predicted metal-binding membrane protein
MVDDLSQGLAQARSEDRPLASPLTEPAGRDRVPAAGRVRIPASALFLFSIGLLATIYFCRTMGGGMPMPGGWTMSMIWMRMPDQSWLAATSMFLLMWLAMMVAMMLPSMTPMLSKIQPPRSALLATCGYFLPWIALGMAVYPLGLAWALAAMRWPELSRAVPALMGGMLALAGAFQFSPWKTKGLSHCRDPVQCGIGENAASRTSPISLGMRLGVSCAICCAGLMLALLALGMMSPLAMLVIAVLITLEKLVPSPKPMVYATGFAGLFAGAVLWVTEVIRSF